MNTLLLRSTVVARPRGIRGSDLGLRWDYVYYDLLDRSYVFLSVSESLNFNTVSFY